MSNGNDRFKRRDPERTEPIRSRQATQRSADAWQKAGSDPGYPSSNPPHPSEARGSESHRQPFGPDPAAGPQPTGGADWQETVNRGVELGYKVVEEQIRQGQEMARLLSGFGSPGSGLGSPGGGLGSPGGDELGELMRRALRYSEDMADLVFRYLGSMAGRGAAADWLSPYSAFMASPWSTGPRSAPGQSWETQRREARPFDPGSGDSRRPFDDGSPRGSAASPYSGAQAMGLAVEISCSRPTKVLVQLAPGAADRRLACRGLVGSDLQNPLADLEFVLGAEPMLTICISDDHPDGRYDGTIIDTDLDAPCGFVTVWLGPSPGSVRPFPQAVKPFHDR